MLTTVVHEEKKPSRFQQILFSQIIYNCQLFGCHSWFRVSMYLHLSCIYLKDLNPAILIKFAHAVKELRIMIG